MAGGAPTTREGDMAQDRGKLGRPCTVCEHPARDEINQAIVLKTRSNRDIAYRFRARGLLHADAIGRHAKAHIPEELVKEIIVQSKRERTAKVDAEINQDQVDISTGLQRIVREIDGILQRAKDAGDDGLALTALRDMRGTLMDLAKLYGKLREVSTLEVKILEAPQWVQLRAILVEVFNAHPAAGAAFLDKTRHMKLLDHA
jgi:hypothetical protein